MFIHRSPLPYNLCGKRREAEGKVPDFPLWLFAGITLARSRQLVHICFVSGDAVVWVDCHWSECLLIFKRGCLTTDRSVVNHRVVGSIPTLGDLRLRLTGLLNSSKLESTLLCKQLTGFTFQGKVICSTGPSRSEMGRNFALRQVLMYIMAPPLWAYQ